MSEIIFLSGTPPKPRTLDRSCFDFESWRTLVREASASDDKKTVRAYFCPEKRGGCGRQRAFRIQEFSTGDRYAVQLACIAKGCGRFYVLEAEAEKLKPRALADAMWLQDEAKAARDKMRDAIRAAQEVK